MAYGALPDANVLHPQILCDLLLRLAEHGAFRPLWSAEILEETVESIRRRRQDLDPERLRRRMAAMNEAFPDACVSGFEHLLPTMPEMGKDAHVLAAALFAEADVIVSDNVKDCPPHVAPQFEIAVQAADQFLVQQWAVDPRLVASILVGAVESNQPAAHRSASPAAGVGPRRATIRRARSPFGRSRLSRTPYSRGRKR